MIRPLPPRYRKKNFDNNIRRTGRIARNMGFEESYGHVIYKQKTNYEKYLNLSKYNLFNLLFINIK